MGNKKSKSKKNEKKEEVPGNHQIKMNPKNMCKNYIKTPSKLTERTYLKNQKKFNKEKINIKNLLEKYEKYRKDFFCKNKLQDLFIGEKPKINPKLIEFENFINPLLNDKK